MAENSLNQTEPKLQWHSIHVTGQRKTSNLTQPVQHNILDGTKNAITTSGPTSSLIELQPYSRTRITYGSRINQMGKIIATCGHELAINEGLGVMVAVRERSRDGSRCISYPSVCYSCLEKYKAWPNFIGIQETGVKLDLLLDRLEARPLGS